MYEHKCCGCGAKHYRDTLSPSPWPCGCGSAIWHWGNTFQATTTNAPLPNVTSVTYVSEGGKVWKLDGPPDAIAEFIAKQDADPELIINGGDVPNHLFGKTEGDLFRPTLDAIERRVRRDAPKEWEILLPCPTHQPYLDHSQRWVVGVRCGGRTSTCWIDDVWIQRMSRHKREQDIVRASTWIIDTLKLDRELSK